MSNLLKRSIWFNRLVLGIGVLQFTQLALGAILGPLAVANRTHTTLGSPDAITVVRVQGSTAWRRQGLMSVEPPPKSRQGTRRSLLAPRLNVGFAH